MAGGQEEKVVIPDATINCRVQAKKGNSFFDIPRFVMEVVSRATEKYDRGEKMEIYQKMEVDEYWIVDWKKNRLKSIHLIMMKMSSRNMASLRSLLRKIKKNWKLFIFQTLKLTLMSCLLLDKWSGILL